MATPDSSLDVFPRSTQWRPSWRRPGLAHKTTLRGTLSRDPVQESSETPSNAVHRIRHLEKNVLFLREQHTETLEQLHKEIERLKAENRELTFKLVMCRCSSGESVTIATPDTTELRSLRASLAQERARSRQLKALIERKVLEQQKSEPCERSRPVGVVHTTLNEAQPLSLAEIRHIQVTNTQQRHELEQIKADLRDVLYSHKWTPDAFLLARAYVNEDKKQSDTLPQLPPTDANMFDRAYQRVHEEVTLPALTPHIKAFPDRQKRSQALRNKLAKSLL